MLPTYGTRLSFFGTIKEFCDFTVEERLENNALEANLDSEIQEDPEIIDFRSFMKRTRSWDVSIKVSVSHMPTERLIDPRKKVEVIETSIMTLNMTWSITMAQNAMFYMNIRLLKELMQITKFFLLPARAAFLFV